MVFDRLPFETEMNAKSDEVELKASKLRKWLFATAISAIERRKGSVEEVLIEMHLTDKLAEEIKKTVSCRGH